MLIVSSLSFVFVCSYITVVFLYDMINDNTVVNIILLSSITTALSPFAGSPIIAVIINSIILMITLFVFYLHYNTDGKWRNTIDEYIY